MDSPPRKNAGPGNRSTREEDVNQVSTPTRANRTDKDEPGSRTPEVETNEMEIVEDDDLDDGGGGDLDGDSSNSNSKISPTNLTEKAAPVLAKLSSWGKQANANAKDFWSKRRVTGSTLAESFKKSLPLNTVPLTSASLDVPNPTRAKGSESRTTDERKTTAEAKEAETLSSSPKATAKEIDAQQQPTTPEKGKPVAVIRSAAATPPPPQNRTPSSMPSSMATIPLRAVESAPPNLLNMSSLLSPQSVQTGVSDDAASFVSYDDDTASSYWSSTYTSDDGARGTFKWAAASVVDSMQQTYRGRYNRSSSEISEMSSPTSPYARSNSAPTPSSGGSGSGSQTHRILQSRAKHHLQELMETLESHEYIMLLGNGMLGVNLKPTYLKHGGVYVDYLVQGGAAERSGIVRPGDSLRRIGESDVRRGTILQVPGQIAQARRPVHLVFATGDVNKDRVTYIDIATALVHMCVETSERKVVRFDIDAAVVHQNGEHVTKNDTNNESTSATMELVQPTSFDAQEEGKDKDSDPAIPDMPYSSEGFLRPSIPTLEIREAFAGRAAQRCNETFFRADRLWPSASNDTNLLHALKHAFALTTADVRRLPFLVRQWSKEDEEAQADGHQYQESQITNSPNALLMLYLEIFQFVDLFGVTPIARRREIAQKIANKFFLPINMGGDLVPPMLDFHHIVSGASLRKLETALKDKSKPLSVELFRDFQQAVIDALTGQHFLSFLVSNECSLMRAYMRNTAPFLNLPLDVVILEAVGDRNYQAKNYLMYMVVYLVSQTDPEEVGETNEIVDSNNRDNKTRVDDAAASLCAALFIKRNLLKAIHTIEEKKNNTTTKNLFTSMEKFWELFLSPTVGSLESTSLSADTRSKVKMLRSELVQIGAPCRHKIDDVEAAMLTKELTLSQLTEPQLVESLENLAERLLYDYAVIDHSKFRAHKIHEWMCQEAIKAKKEENPAMIPSFAPDCIKRLLRKVNFPNSVSSHKPFHASAPQRKVPVRCTAECAVVFGSSTGLNSSFDQLEGRESIERYASVPLEGEGHDLTPEQLPPTLEGYAIVPSVTYHQPFQHYGNSGSTSADGWEVSLLNFSVPQANSGSEEAEDSALYGVSLVLRRTAIYPDDDANTAPTKVEQSLTIPDGIHFKGSGENRDLKRIVVVQSECAVFNARLKEQKWRKGHSVRSSVVGIALVSGRNAIPSMRQGLEILLHRFCPTGRDGMRCNGLADFLGNFSNNDVETEILADFVQPFLNESLKPWLERPLGAQQALFEAEAGEQLIRSLPPIPLALLFITAMLEQKIVITGSRRSILLSATTALTEMLKPLKWCHLLVPRVPAALAGDLLQYPAPFILGMPAQDPGILELIRELPEDVTLVDLDVGRVILASSFAHNSELCRGTPKNENTARALRTQVLSLAQCLGNVFGAYVDQTSWGCDKISERTHPGTPFSGLKAVCRDFVEEILAGTTSCCYWVEEATSGDKKKAGDPTVLFDEDRFFRVKAERAKMPFCPLLNPSSEGSKLAMSIDGFGMVLEILLRCQSMNAYIGSCDRKDMLFSI